ncbi:MAG: M28 family peptidase [Polyangiales bacterium]
MFRFPVLILALCSACGAAAPAGSTTPTPVQSAPNAKPAPEERHFAELRQLTFEGENAEAYFSFDGQQVSMQRRTADMGCDRIYTLPIFAQGVPVANQAPHQISNGQGATTCSHFFPDGKEVLYASTHLGGPDCPPKPDMSQGYVWAIYDSYDIFKAKADGSDVRRLTDTPGYDAEGTVCGRDGSIIFTSTRDNDIELYRMDADGKNVKRLTNEPGYDGGAFFNADCSKIVWRASRPKPGPELDNYRALLAKGLVRPTKLELYVANGDGSEARQVTYLDAATFAPFWFPGQDRIIFSSNYGDPKGREFDLWAIDGNGTNLERITYTPGFDGFPMFTPDGKWLLFSSNRATAPGANDTNLFLARFDQAPAAAPAAPTAPAPTASPAASTGAAERIWRDAAWLADPAREGRGIGTPGLEASGAYIEQRMRELGLAPLGDNGTYRAAFQVTTALKRGQSTELKIADKPVAAELYVPLGYSAPGNINAPAVLAGYAIVDSALGLDDFRGLDVRNKIVIARRFAPDHPQLTNPADQRRAGDLRKKAFEAKTRGAKALVVVDWPVTAPSPAAHGGAAAPAAPAAPAAHGGGAPAAAPGATSSSDPHAAPSGGQAPSQLPAEAALPELQPEGPGDAGIPVVIVKREALTSLWPQLEARKPVKLALNVALERSQATAFNVVGKIPAGKPSSPAAKAIIIGAHYDHLGYGGRNSLAPDRHDAHLGADDNASGVATVLEIAQQLVAARAELTHDVIVAAFSGEESGVLGSAALVASKPSWLSQARAMINLDMVGRLRGNTLSVLGSQTADEWTDIVKQACESAHVVCNSSGDGYGPSDQISFYTFGLPVLHLFSGAHSDYHKPSDTAAQLNAAGMAQISQIGTKLVEETQKRELHHRKLAAPTGPGDARSWNASLGTVPDYAGPPQGTRGVLLADVRPGGGADQAGMRRGDVLTRLGKFPIASVEDLMFVLMQAKPGETVTAVVTRAGQEVQLNATFQEGRRR